MFEEQLDWSWLYRFCAFGVTVYAEDSFAVFFCVSHSGKHFMPFAIKEP